RMRNQASHGLKRFNCPSRTPRQVENQRLPAHSADPAAQCSKLSLFEAFTPHSLSHAVDQPLANRRGRFGRNISRSDSRSSGGHNQTNSTSQLNERVLNLDQLVRNNFVRCNRESKFLQELRHGWSGEIF